jgi:hypothetical protein
MAAPSLSDSSNKPCPKPVTLVTWDRDRMELSERKQRTWMGDGVKRKRVNECKGDERQDGRVDGRGGTGRRKSASSVRGPGMD